MCIHELKLELFEKLYIYSKVRLYSKDSDYLLGLHVAANTNLEHSCPYVITL